MHREPGIVIYTVGTNGELRTGDSEMYIVALVMHGEPGIEKCSL